MKPSPGLKVDEIERNLVAFVQQMPALLANHANEYALLRHGTIVGFYPTALDAQIAGNQRYEDGLFSFQCVTNRVEGLGFLTYANDHRHS